MPNKTLVAFDQHVHPVYQFHLLLHGVNPPVWRRIQMRSNEGIAVDAPISKAEGLRKGIVLIRYVMTLKNAIKSYEARDTAAATKMLTDLRQWLATQKELFQGEKRFDDDVELAGLLGSNMNSGANILKPDPSGMFYTPPRP